MLRKFNLVEFYFYTNLSLQGPIDKFSKLAYNGIFLRRQIFAGLSKKHGDYFSWILIFAVGNIPKK